MTKIFISHKKEDSELASEISLELRRKGIDNYLDILDPYLTGDGDVLTTHLRKQLNSCTHLLAVLTGVTHTSWWVPFEIGLATERDYPISSFVLPTVGGTLPSYLHNWPVLKSFGDLDKYSATILKGRYTIIREYAQKEASSTGSYTEAFHKNLKRELGQ